MRGSPQTIERTTYARAQTSEYLRSPLAAALEARLGDLGAREGDGGDEAEGDGGDVGRRALLGREHELAEDGGRDLARV